MTRAAAFYQAVLGRRYRPGGLAHGRAIEGPPQPMGLLGGQEHSTLMARFAVDDMHEAARRVRDAGGEAAEPRSEPYGQTVDCTDDQGMAFAVFAPGDGVRAPSDQPRHGEISYLTFAVPDSARFRAFFGRVLGWEFVPGRVEGTPVRPRVGLHGGHERSTVVPTYTVDDIDAAVRNAPPPGAPRPTPPASSTG